MVNEGNKKYLLAQLNYIRMCESDKAIINRIESIFADGIQEGYKQSDEIKNDN